MAEVVSPRAEGGGYRCGVELIGQAPAFLELLNQLPRMALIDAPVLIEGETGTGKELIARAVHYSGARRAMPFIPVNCGALPESLIENELFGHGRGAYTDAREPQPGLIAQAQGGTLFLDEIDTIPFRGQVALLRFLQDSRYRPLGATRDECAQVRIIAATNADLEALVAERQFRSDLFYRLKVFGLIVPPLRQRLGDAELLAQHFVRLYSRQYALEERPIQHPDLLWIRDYAWPGNVRELENLIHRGVVQSPGMPALELGCVPRQRPAPPLRQPHPARQAEASYRELGFRRAKAAAIYDFERSFIEQALVECRGNVSAAARLSGKERRAFGRLMKKHGLRKFQFVHEK
jgi:two-component system, NtrC family, response regulator GlrR